MDPGTCVSSALPPLLLLLLLLLLLMTGGVETGKERICVLTRHVMFVCHFHCCPALYDSVAVPLRTLRDEIVSANNRGGKVRVPLHISSPSNRWRFGSLQLRT